ncbi:MAG: hypothetical protein NZ772_00170 [Cyanobacteria bacterium]|nr:hypothetical protein [Cyanobacteriota bacterium]MDW8199605.1 hypothetical protein [Cyanobacteriota bacterium SKYGB_h_bin112]
MLIAGDNAIAAATIVSLRQGLDWEPVDCWQPSHEFSLGTYDLAVDSHGKSARVGFGVCLGKTTTVACDHEACNHKKWVQGESCIPYTHLLHYPWFI